MSANVGVVVEGIEDSDRECRLHRPNDFVGIHPSNLAGFGRGRVYGSWIEGGIRRF
jgi:hypothetical protein